MKGMWTKQLSNDGRVFYYNAHINKSVWNTPNEAVLYEAPNLKKPNQAKELLEELNADIAPTGAGIEVPTADYNAYNQQALYYLSQQQYDPTQQVTNEPAHTSFAGPVASLTNESKESNNFINNSESSRFLQFCDSCCF